MKRTANETKEGTVIRFTKCKVLRNGKISRDDLWVQNGKIIDPDARFWRAAEQNKFASNTVVDCLGLILAPGFIDLQESSERE